MRRDVSQCLRRLCAPERLSCVDIAYRHSLEREALIRWRLGQEKLFPLVGAKVVSQPLSPNGKQATGPQTVLAVAIQETVLHQYEEACEAVGLAPMQVDVVSFRLFNLWSRAAQGARGNGADD